MNNHPHEPASHNHYEDLALKQAMTYFGNELLPFFGITQKVIAVLPTESIHLEAKQMYQDYNFLMEDGSIAHFEFESDALRDEDFRRFRLYEAHMSYTQKRAVTTYVICSAKVRNRES